MGALRRPGKAGPCIVAALIAFLVAWSLLANSETARAEQPAAPPAVMVAPPAAPVVLLLPSLDTATQTDQPPTHPTTDYACRA